MRARRFHPPQGRSLFRAASGLPRQDLGKKKQSPPQAVVGGHRGRPPHQLRLVDPTSQHCRRRYNLAEWHPPSEELSCRSSRAVGAATLCKAGSNSSFLLTASATSVISAARTRARSARQTRTHRAAHLHAPPLTPPSQVCPTQEFVAPPCLPSADQSKVGPRARGLVASLGRG